MLVILEFFAGIVAVFLIGYFLAIGLEKIFHINLTSNKKK